jgi:hypothetical protein
MVMRVKVNKIEYGNVSIRDYLVNLCIKKQENMEVDVKGEIMVIPFDKLKLGHKRGLTIISQFDNTKFYDLIDFQWIPRNN